MRVIDFAHAYPLRCARDSGYLYGLHNLIRILEGLMVCDQQRQREPSRGVCGGSGASAQPADTDADDDEAKDEQVHSSAAAAATSQVVERALDLSLSAGEAGGVLEAGGTVPHEGNLAASAGYVRLHQDEFLEALAHTRLGRWCPGWQGFSSELDAGGEPKGGAPNSGASGVGASGAAPPFSKHVCMRHACMGYERPRALCFRLGDSGHGGGSNGGNGSGNGGGSGNGSGSGSGNGNGNGVPLGGVGCGVIHLNSLLADEGGHDETPHERLVTLLHTFLEETSARESMLLLASFSAQLSELIADLTAGSVFQFASGSMWLVYDGGSAGSEAAPGIGSPMRRVRGVAPLSPSVRLSHFADVTMHRTESCHQPCLAGMHALHLAIRAAIRSRRPDY